MTSLDFITSTDIQRVQFGQGMRSSIIERVIDWLSDHIGGTNRLAVIDCLTGMFDQDEAIRNKSCDNLRDLLGYKAANLFLHGVDEDGQFFTEFHTPIYGCDAIRVLRGQAGDKAEYVISRGFVDQEPQAAILDAYFPVHNTARMTATVAISTMLNRYATDFAKREAFANLMEVASPELKSRMTRTATGSIAVNFGLMPLASNFVLSRELMVINRADMQRCLNVGAAKDLDEMPVGQQLEADIVRDAYYFDGDLIEVGEYPSAAKGAVDELLATLRFMGASTEQMEVMTAVANQRMYGMILESMTWGRSAMIPSTSSHGGMSRFDIYFEEADQSIRVVHTRKQDICAGLGGLISDFDVENHYDTMQEEVSAVVKSTETEFNLRINQDGSVDVLGVPMYAYNPEVPK